MEAISRIVIVDDNHYNLTAFSKLLESEKNKIVTASSGEEALKILLNDADFSLILLDVQMPGMDGIEVARLVKSRDKTRDIPIIFISAVQKSEQIISEGFFLGAYDYITKPVEPYLLRSKVEVFLELNRSRRELLKKNSTIQEMNEDLEKKVLERTTSLEKAQQELQHKIQELERFNKIMIGRELEMIKLKEEVNSLRVESGKERKYTIPGKTNSGEEVSAQ